MAEAIREVIATEDRTALREAIAAEDRATASLPGVAVHPVTEHASDAETTAEAQEPASASGSLIEKPVAISLSVAALRTTGTHAEATARRPWGLAAMLILGAVLGGGAVSLLTEARSGERPATTERAPALTTPAAPSAPTALLGSDDGHAAETPPKTPNELAVPTSVVAPAPAVAPAPPSAPRRLASVGTNKPAPTFERVMRALEGKARECARAADVAEKPLEVQVIGEGPTISTVRVIGLGGRPRFTGCLEAAIRKAAPPLGSEPIRQYTFFEEMK
jgi:hypothetical protein